MATQEDWDFCLPKELPAEHQAAAALTAGEVNPANRLSPEGVAKIMPALSAMLMGGPAAALSAAGATAPLVTNTLIPGFLALLTSKYWGSGGVDLTVGFMEQTPSDLRERILSHMNAWQEYSNVKFRWTQTSPQVRISRGKGGYWSYLGTDVLHIPANQPTMNLQAFTMSTSESEYRRVVRHETGHTLGFPHEHMRRELVANLDPESTIAWGKSALGWDRQTVIQQILTPLEDSSVLGTDHADTESIMCYQLPASITKDGKPIVGGSDIDPDDQRFAAKVYPKPDAPKPPEPPVKPKPPIDGDSMSKEQLANLLNTAAKALRVLAGFGAWIPGIGKFAPLLLWTAGLLEALAANDLLLSLILSVAASGQVNIPEPPAALPTEENFKQLEQVGCGAVVQ